MLILIYLYLEIRVLLSRLLCCIICCIADELWRFLSYCICLHGANWPKMSTFFQSFKFYEVWERWIWKNSYLTFLSLCDENSEFPPHHAEFLFLLPFYEIALCIKFLIIHKWYLSYFKTCLFFVPYCGIYKGSHCRHCSKILGVVGLLVCKSLVSF